MERPSPQSIPDAPGSYQFRDAEGRVIYVGKAKSLRARVTSYFQPLHLLTPKTQAMVLNASSVEWITVSSDVEALILEYNLIKEHQPRYNVRLRDDKSYPMLALTISDEWPRVTVVRGKQRKGVRYFGPYPHASAVRETLDLLQRSFPLRSCSDAKFSRQNRLGRPCLLYHIERCCGPCIDAVDRERYGEITEEMSRFLRGDTASIVGRLDREMRAAAADLDFEVAARLRDRLEAVRKVVERQEIVSSPTDNFDVIGYVDDELEARAQVFRVRRGRIVGRRGLSIDKVEDLSASVLMERFLELHYGDGIMEVPPKIYVAEAPSGLETVEGWLRGLRSGPVKISVPQRGHKRQLIQMAVANAREEFKRERMRRASDHNARSQALNALQQALGLSSAPLRIECYDMSHLQGSNYVGSMVVMEDALIKRKDYRRFKVSTPKNDDFAAMEEVLRRRLQRLLDEEKLPIEERSKRFAYRPNLIVVDGGQGQLSVAVKVREELGLTDQIELAGLAKEFEEIYLPYQHVPLRLPRQSPALYLLQTLRDEAHRFAITFHRSLRSKSVGALALDEVVGIGPKRRAQLLKHFGGVRNLRAASLEALVNSGVVSATLAEEVYQALHPSSDLPTLREGPGGESVLLEGS
ncbi:MAG: excinuclease ABC subunit UvrC [Acidimicrobiales bacterium]